MMMSQRFGSALGGYSSSQSVTNGQNIRCNLNAGGGAGASGNSTKASSYYSKQDTVRDICS